MIMHRMVSIFAIFVVLLCCSSCNLKNSKTENQIKKPTQSTSILKEIKDESDINFPIDIQIEGGNLGKSYFYRIKSNRTILSKTLDGEYMNLFEDTPKGFNYIRINEDCTEEEIDIESQNRIKSLIFELTKIKTDYYTLDGMWMYVYFNNQVIAVDVSGSKANNENLYKIFKNIVNILNENTSLYIDDKYY